MNRESFDLLLNVIRNRLTRQNTVLRNCLTPENVLACGLLRLAHGNSYKTIGPALNVGRTTAIEAYQDVVEALYDLRNEYIEFPTTVAETMRCRETFTDKSRLPNIVGAIDGTHIKIVAPRDGAVDYFSRNQQHDFIIQAVADVHRSWAFLFSEDVGRKEVWDDSGIESSSTNGKDSDNEPELAVEGDGLAVPRSLKFEMCQALEEKDNKIVQLEQKNDELLKYVACLEKSPVNKGKDIADVTKKSRTLKTFLSRANTALWFSKSFGLYIHEIVVKEQKTREAHILMGNGENGKTKGGIDSLADTEKANIEQVLFLLDKFCVGDVSYHEQTMIVDGLPKSYLVKQQRDKLNDICQISPTPGNAEGAQMSFTDFLKERVADMMSREEGKNWTDKPIQVKISGDGAHKELFIHFAFIFTTTCWG
ncbi:putative nuclease HARBI1 [Stylophora pistillata]|uniref:Putative nuclease HARBI1 n=1 Tax=Stylophora pistillata TaxID=50429 RepID=A0A2B4RBE0_STYPI|nr:putative nuclease HARBI1 [Stylophora pistillata]